MAMVRLKRCGTGRERGYRPDPRILKNSKFEGKLRKSAVFRASADRAGHSAKKRQDNIVRERDLIEEFVEENYKGKNYKGKIYKGDVEGSGNIRGKQYIVENGEEWELQEGEIMKETTKEFSPEFKGPIRYEDQKKSIRDRKAKKIEKMLKIRQEKLLGDKQVSLPEDDPITANYRRTARSVLYDKHEKYLNNENYTNFEEKRTTKPNYELVELDSLEQARPGPSPSSNHNNLDKSPKSSKALNNEISTPTQKIQKSPQIENSQQTEKFKKNENFELKPLVSISPKMTKAVEKMKQLEDSVEKLSKGDVESVESDESGHNIYGGRGEEEGQRIQALLQKKFAERSRSRNSRNDKRAGQKLAVSLEKRVNQMFRNIKI
jgi:hypothetical protein